MINSENYTLELCPYCENEVVIHAKGVTGCPECGAPVTPCSICEDCLRGMAICRCPYACTGDDGHLPITNPMITLEEIAEHMECVKRGER